MSTLQRNIVWAVVGAVALLAIGAFATAVSGGPLDPPGPPAPTGPIQVQIVTTTPAASEFTTVVIDCNSVPSPPNVRAALLGGIGQLNGLGAAGWQLVGPPTLNITGSGCVAVYTLQKAAGGAGTPTLTPFPTSTSTGTPATSTSLPNTSTPAATATQTPSVG